MKKFKKIVAFFEIIVLVTSSWADLQSPCKDDPKCEGASINRSTRDTSTGNLHHIMILPKRSLESTPPNTNISHVEVKILNTTHSQSTNTTDSAALLHHKAKRLVEGEPNIQNKSLNPLHAGNITQINQKFRRYTEEQSQKNVSSQTEDEISNPLASSSVTQHNQTTISRPAQDTVFNPPQKASSTEQNQINMSSPIQQEASNLSQNNTELKQKVKRLVEELPKNISLQIEDRVLGQTKENVKPIVEEASQRNISIPDQEKAINSSQSTSTTQQNQKIKRFAEEQYAKNATSQTENRVLNPSKISNGTQTLQNVKRLAEEEKNESLQFESKALNPTQNTKLPGGNQTIKRSVEQELSKMGSSQMADKNLNPLQDDKYTQKDQKPRRFLKAESPKNLSSNNETQHFSQKTNPTRQHQTVKRLVESATYRKEPAIPSNQTSAWAPFTSSYLPSSNSQDKNNTKRNVQNTTSPATLDINPKPQQKPFKRDVPETTLSSIPLNTTSSNINTTEVMLNVTSNTTNQKEGTKPKTLSKRQVQSPILVIGENIDYPSSIPSANRRMFMKRDNTNVTVKSDKNIKQNGNLTSVEGITPNKSISGLAKVKRSIDVGVRTEQIAFNANTSQNSTHSADHKDKREDEHAHSNKKECEQHHCEINCNSTSNSNSSIVKRHAKEKSKKKPTKKISNKKHKGKAGIKRDVLTNTTMNPLYSNNYTLADSNFKNLNTTSAVLDNLNSNNITVPKKIQRRTADIRIRDDREDTSKTGTSRIKRSVINDNQKNDKLLKFSIIKRSDEFLDSNQNLDHQNLGVLPGEASLFLKKLLPPGDDMEITGKSNTANSTQKLMEVNVNNKINGSSIHHIPGFLLRDGKAGQYKQVFDNLKKGFIGVGCACPINYENIITENLPRPVIQGTLVSLPRGVPDFVKEIMCSAACCQVNSLYSSVEKEVICHGVREWKKSESEAPHLRELWEAEHFVMCSFLSEGDGATVEYILSWLKIIIVYIVGILLIIVLICLYLTCYLRPPKQPQQNLKKELVQLVLNKKSGKSKPMGFLVSPVAPATP